MTVENMMNKREIATTINLVIMEQVGGDTYMKPSMMEDFEQMSFDDYLLYVDEKLKEHNIKALISIAWAKTKFIFEKQKKFYDYLNSSQEEDFYIIWMPEIFGFILTRTKEDYLNIIKNLKEGYKIYCDLFIKDIIENDNSIEIEYINRNALVEFEEKPLSVQEDERELLVYPS